MQIAIDGLLRPSQTRLRAYSEPDPAYAGSHALHLVGSSELSLAWQFIREVSLSDLYAGLTWSFNLSPNFLRP
jgi:hypothetical protein